MLTQAESRLLHALKSRSGREKHGWFMVEGVRVVEELLASGIDLKFAAISPTLEDSRRGMALKHALEAKTVVRRLSERQLREIAETDTPQGVLAVARIPASDLAVVKLGTCTTVLVLDAVQDPGNVGTLIRSADAFAVAAVIALPGTVDYWNSKVVRSAAGAAFRVPLMNASADDIWDWLSRNQFTICGADMTGVRATAIDRNTRIALVAGNEGNGLRKETRSRITQLVSIPMPGNAESLNVAVAAAILLYELSKTE